jgi:hypothetical protein
MFEDVMNVNLGPNERKEFITGIHVVADMNCIGCQSPLGWKYIEAHDEKEVIAASHIIAILE